MGQAGATDHVGSEAARAQRTLQRTALPWWPRMGTGHAGRGVVPEEGSKVRLQSPAPKAWAAACVSDSLRPSQAPSHRG